MNSVIEQVNSERVELGEVLPLEVPFTLNVCPTTYCNFACAYCIHSLPEVEKIKVIGPKAHMSLDRFRKVVDGLKPFAAKLKCIVFASFGEPLLNPALPEMIAYASERHVTERIEVITNAYSLTHEKSDALIKAGLTSLRISVQGLDAETYKEISGVAIDFDRYMEQIRYFYRKKQGNNCSVFAKIADVSLKEGQDEDFYGLFGDCTDRMYVEHIFRQFDQIDYGRLGENLCENKSGLDRELDVAHVEICPFPFYSISVYVDGTIYNCHDRNYSHIGNIEDMSVYEAWNAPTTRDFFCGQLSGREAETCRSCKLRRGLIKAGDNIDAYREVILQKISGGRDS
jgi:radical SAM protein with 4Fe4S-binding SPASM domain